MIFVVCRLIIVHLKGPYPTARSNPCKHQRNIFEARQATGPICICVEHISRGYRPELEYVAHGWRRHSTGGRIILERGHALVVQASHLRPRWIPFQVHTDRTRFFGHIDKADTHRAVTQRMRYRVILDQQRVRPILDVHRSGEEKAVNPVGLKCELCREE